MNTVHQYLADVEASLRLLDDTVIIRDVREKLADLIDLADDKIDLALIEERRGEPTIPHSQLTQELRNDGLL